LGDLGYIGPNYTWNNGRGGADFIQERLDRALANCGWCSLFPHVTVTVLAASRSDHNPISVLFSEVQEVRHNYRRSFKFEDAWTKDGEFNQVIQNSWGEDCGGYAPLRDVQSKLSSCQNHLYRWSKRKFGHSEELIKRKKAQLIQIQSKGGHALETTI
jgi:hypothetical protein